MTKAGFTKERCRHFYYRAVFEEPTVNAMDLLMIFILQSELHYSQVLVARIVHQRQSVTPDAYTFGQNNNGLLFSSSLCAYLGSGFHFYDSVSKHNYFFICLHLLLIKRKFKGNSLPLPFSDFLLI